MIKTYNLNEFEFNDGEWGNEVDIDSLINSINSIKDDEESEVVIQTCQVEPEINLNTLKEQTSLRSSFETSLKGSQKGRFNNVKKALSLLNGKKIEPNEIFSFNGFISKNSSDDDFEDAITILSGKYVPAKGGGLCQVSSTLYNALIRADLEILEVHNHSIPVKYVSKSFDAMVNGSGADLVFKNSSNFPITISSYIQDENAVVKIFGEKLEEGLEIKPRVEFVKVLKHGGDEIVPDVKKEYEKKIMFKGEYLRIQEPKDGEEVKGFLDYFKNGELLKSVEVRDCFYPSQRGIIMEGTEEVYDGITLPENNVKFINAD